jgi:hypothetical protein
MATKLGKIDSRSVVRETADLEPLYRERKLMVSLDAGGRFLEIWEKGRRRRFKVAYSTVYGNAVNAAIYAAAREAKIEKQRKREERLRLRRA